MALKDWRKIKEEKDRILWRKRKDATNYSILVKKVYFLRTKYWKLDTLDSPPNAPHKERYYKTKQKALDAAKRFMRRH